MKSGLPILLALLVSCGEKPPVSHRPTAPESNPTLAAAQFALAQNHLANDAPRKAIPYLVASLTNEPSPETQSVLDEVLTTTDFTLPVIELRHPYPVLRFKEAGKNLFVAIGGRYPTAIRWNLSDEPSVGAVMFPAKTKGITHLSVSPDTAYIIIHRDGLNLLCHADTLKPITVLDPFAEGLNPETCQPFSENGLFFANPTSDLNHFTIWRIHDSKTGEVLRSESLAPTSVFVSAAFAGTTLRVSLADGGAYTIPLSGETEFHRAPSREAATRPAPSLITRTSENTLTLHRTIRLTSDEIADTADESFIALSGYELDPATQTLSEIPVPNRLETLAKELPGTLPETLRLFSSETTVNRRLADAHPHDFPELTAADRSHAEIIRQVFATGDREAILAVIDDATRGLPIATALFLAIDSQDAEYIARAIGNAPDLPPPLLALAQGDAAALTDFGDSRQIRDWLGYESPDFTPLLAKLRMKRAEAVAALTLPEHPTEDDISAFSLRLTDAATQETLGKPLVAEKAITAARLLAENPSHAETALRLAGYAQNLGTHPSDCLRVRAAAFTTLSDFDTAHVAWIDLITHQPEATHLPTDYTEAAHTAFETGDPRQAIEILNTGLFRFPNAPSAAIRSAWIALLTDHNDDALRYLNHAAKLGLPPAEIENTTALLAITHERLGDHEAAVAYHAQLTAISPKWADAEALAKLPWPESFKASLNAILFSGGETEPWPSPESDPTDTVPLPGEFPIEEPPLPSR